MKYVPIAALALLVATSTSNASADETPTATETNWYGWQTLATDVPATAMIATAFAIRNNDSLEKVVGYSGALLYVAGAPAVHAAHGRFEIMGVSLGLRTVGPLLGFVLGFVVGEAVAPKRNDWAGAVEPAAYGEGGFLIGGGIAIAADTLFLAREKVVVPAPAPARAASAAHWSPTLAPRAGGVSGGISGTF